MRRTVLAGVVGGALGLFVDSFFVVNTNLYALFLFPVLFVVPIFCGLAAAFLARRSSWSPEVRRGLTPTVIFFGWPLAIAAPIGAKWLYLYWAVTSVAFPAVRGTEVLSTDIALGDLDISAHASVFLRTPAPPGEVLSFYLKSLPRQGWMATGCYYSGPAPSHGCPEGCCGDKVTRADFRGMRAEAWIEARRNLSGFTQMDQKTREMLRGYTWVHIGFIPQMPLLVMGYELLILALGGGVVAGVMLISRRLWRLRSDGGSRAREP